MIKRIESGIAGRGLELDYLSFVKDVADSYGLVGTAFEKNDGSIKLIAEGEEEDLIEFAEKIEDGGYPHVIENFYVNWSEPSGEFKDFSIGDKMI